MSAYYAFRQRIRGSLDRVTASYRRRHPGKGAAQTFDTVFGPFENGPHDIAREGEW